MLQNTRTNRSTCVGMLALGACLTFAACASNNDRIEIQQSRIDVGAQADAPTDEQDVVRRDIPLRTMDDDVVILGAPGAATQPARPTGEVFVVDQLVGQINGKPIYASEFFAPMEARLRASAARMGEVEWLRETKSDIKEALLDRVRDEILLAEFKSSLTPEQRQGVLYFIDRLRDDLISDSLGSSKLANARTLEAEGLTLDDKVEDMAEKEFIGAHLRKEINSRVHITPREVRQFYERNIDRYQPAPIAHFRLIRIPVDRAAEVEAALDSSEPVAAVAERLSTWNASDAARHDAVIKTRDLATAEIIGIPDLNAAAQRLSVGQVTPRVDQKDAAYWLYLERIEHPPGRDLYEVQLEIEEELRRTRYMQEHERYFKTLLSRANFSDIDEMADQLFAYAAERFLIQPDRTGQRRPAPEGDGT